MAGIGAKKRGGGPKNARKAAFNVLNRVFGADAYADIVLEREAQGLKPIDRALATELVYGVLRWWMRLDWILDAFSTIKTKKLETKVLSALRIGLYQTLFLTRIPASAAVNESVKLVRGPGGKRAGFVNALLRKASVGAHEVKFPDIEKDPVAHISIFYSHPRWMVKRWVERYGPAEAIKICRADNAVPPRCLRVNTLVRTRPVLLNELRESGFEARQTQYSPWGLVISGGGYLSPLDKRFYIQDEASQLVALLLKPRPAEAVLDACSAPGGKTTQMAAMMENSGVIYAVDKSRERLKRVKGAAGRLGAEIVKTIYGDAAEPGFLKEEGEKKFDAILLDAPCTGLGVLRRSPDIKIRRTEDDIRVLAEGQKRLLENMSGHLKEGGRIVYSVCTLEPEETEGVIRWFLACHGEFSLEGADRFFTGGLKELVDKDGFLRTLPHIHGTDGFFAARLKKRR
ncbi:MAG: 16S rRNA (cytosine(967)-C(5))-methyltransferase RsmB [Thermodesulfobacteriota bacterium]